MDELAELEAAAAVIQRQLRQRIRGGRSRPSGPAAETPYDPTMPRGGTMPYYAGGPYGAFGTALEPIREDDGSGRSSQCSPEHDEAKAQIRYYREQLASMQRQEPRREEQAQYYKEEIAQMQAEEEEAQFYKAAMAQMQAEEEQAQYYKASLAQLQTEAQLQQAWGAGEEQAQYYKAALTQLQAEEEQAQYYKAALAQLQAEQEQAQYYKASLAQLQAEEEQAQYYKTSLAQLQEEERAAATIQRRAKQASRRRRQGSFRGSSDAMHSRGSRAIGNPLSAIRDQPTAIGSRGSRASSERSKGSSELWQHDDDVAARRRPLGGTTATWPAAASDDEDEGIGADELDELRALEAECEQYAAASNGYERLMREVRTSVDVNWRAALILQVIALDWRWIRWLPIATDGRGDHRWPPIATDCHRSALIVPGCLSALVVTDGVAQAPAAREHTAAARQRADAAGGGGSVRAGGRALAARVDGTPRGGDGAARSGGGRRARHPPRRRDHPPRALGRELRGEPPGRQPKQLVQLGAWRGTLREWPAAALAPPPDRRPFPGSDPLLVAGGRVRDGRLRAARIRRRGARPRRRVG